MKRRSLQAALLAAGLGPAVPAIVQAAAPAPYTDWAFDLKRAGEDQNRWAELVRQAPHFARIWFYGQIFDLVTVGVTDEVRNALRPRLEVIARTLAELTPPDPTPALLLDRARTGKLEATSTRARQVEDDLIQSARGGAAETANVSAAAHPDLARIVFYRLLARSEATRGRLGGDREAALHLDVARRIAEGYALAVDDLGLWETVARWQGQPGVFVPKALVVDQQVAFGLNAALAGDPVAARARLEDALATARAARGPSFYTALILAGTANMAARAGDAAGARGIRHQVMAQVRPLNDAGLVALIADSLVKTYMVERNWPEVALYTRELRALGPAVTQVPVYLDSLLRAAEALAGAGEAEVAAGRFAAATPLLQEAAQLYALLKNPEIVAVTVPSDQVEPVRVVRERAAAEIQRTAGRIEERRGRLPEARAASEQARAIYEGLGAMDGQGAAEVDLARLELAAGNFDDALARANAAVEHLAYAGPEAQARALRQRGWIRLRRGESAAAFANANAGLELLKAAGDPARFVVERAALHRLAAVALDAAGQPEAARERLAFALKVHPSAETVLLAAQMAFEAGDPAGVEAAFQGVPDAAVDPRVRAIYRGCAQARAGAADAAIGTLAQVNTLVAPSLRPYQIAGRTCLAAAHLGKGQAQAAANDVLPARALAAEFGHPGLAWRVAALEGDVSAALGRAPEAAGAWRQAADRFVEAMTERPDRGWTLDVRLPALPTAPGRALQALPVALSDAAGAGKGDEATTNTLAALSYASFQRQLASSPDQVGTVLVDARPPGELAVRQALAGTIALREPLRDPAIDGSDRGFVLTVLAARTKHLKDALFAGHRDAPAFWSWFLPSPQPGKGLAPAEGEARLFYWTGEEAGRIWLWLPGEPAPRGWKLPGRAALATQLTPALAVTLRPPVAWPPKPRGAARDPNTKDWEALAKPVATLLPFLKDKKVAAALAGKTLRVYADGPLLRFPLEALVVEPPPRKTPGKPPVFLGARYPVTRALLPDQPASQVPRDVVKTWATVGPVAASGGCPTVALAALKGLYDPCLGADAAAETEKVRGAFAAAPEQHVAASGPEATSAAALAALGQARIAHFSLPLDTDTGELLTSAPGAGEAERVGALAVGTAGGRAELALATRLTAPALENETGDGLRRFAAALRYAGVPGFAILAWRNGAEQDAESLTAVAGAVAGGIDPKTALGATAQAALGSAVDPKAGGVPAYHPWFWARWLRYE